jgi:hypothetical protein
VWHPGCCLLLRRSSSRAFAWSGLGLRTGAITAAGCRTSVPISSGHPLYDGPVAVVTEDTARKLLGSTSVLISLVPASCETDELYDASVFTAIPQGLVSLVQDVEQRWTRLIFYPPSKRNNVELLPSM